MSSSEAKRKKKEFFQNRLRKILGRTRPEEELSRGGKYSYSMMITRGVPGGRGRGKRPLGGSFPYGLGFGGFQKRRRPRSPNAAQKRKKKKEKPS